MDDFETLTPDPALQPISTPLKNLSDQHQLITDLLTWIKDDADTGTAATLRSMLNKASDSDIARIRESMTNADPTNRAAWLVGALKTARQERLAEREGGASAKNDLLRMCNRLEGILSQASAQLVDLRTLIAVAPLPEKPPRYRCPQCGIGLPAERSLAFHLANVHDGPPVPLTSTEAQA
jgi:hypothetical protein